MAQLDQNKTPYLNALKKYMEEGISPFDVPGHHMGNVDNDFSRYVGINLYRADVNAPRGLDNLNHPTGVIKEAEALMADAFSADQAFFLLNGTSSGIITMIMSTCKANDRVILPRNCHKSVINGLILSGAMPVFVMPELDSELEIANQPTFEDYRRMIRKHPSAKAVFVINPTYFGAAGDLQKIVKLAHDNSMLCLVDEAHGAHFGFTENSPLSAMECGADMSAVSLHKMGGSLTQSSILLRKGNRVSDYNIRKTLNAISSTSPSSILIASLDAARKFMALEGKEKIDQAIAFANYAREEISKIPGFRPRGKDHFQNMGCFDYDETKLVIELDMVKLTGFELYNLLKDKYHIQMELAETYVVLGIIGIGTKKEHIDNLVKALKEISQEYFIGEMSYPRHHFNLDFPIAILRPRTAYHAAAKRVKLADAIDEISKESIMVYPPGIPLVVPGEMFTEELVRRIEYYKGTGSTILSDYDDGTVSVIDQKSWINYSRYQRKIEGYYSRVLTTPKEDGFIVPFEGRKHLATLMLLPYRKDTWRNAGSFARNNLKEVIEAISQYEPVYLGIDPTIYTKVAKYFRMKNVKILKIEYNDAWSRDNMPIFVVNEKEIRGIDFGFNAWGGNVDGLYTNWDFDDALAKKVCEKLGFSYYLNKGFILEGGSVHFDGEGTCLTTEACLLSEGRNPTLTKDEIENILKEHLNVEKVIWLKNGIYLDETNEHIDNMACFLAPGKIALSWCDDVNDPQYEMCVDAYNTLIETTDSKGRNFEIVKIPLPKPMYMTEEEAKGIDNSEHTSKERLVNSRLSASYVNFYQSDSYVILPAFGVPEDEIAFNIIKQNYPEKEIIQINTREILLGGGNIHCMTMQIPTKL